MSEIQSYLGAYNCNKKSPLQVESMGTVFLDCLSKLNLSPLFVPQFTPSYFPSDCLWQLLDKFNLIKKREKSKISGLHL